MYPEASSKVCHGSFCQMGNKKINTPVQRLKVATLPLDLPCSGPVTHSGKILTTGKTHGKKPDRFSLNDDTDVKKAYFQLKQEFSLSILTNHKRYNFACYLIGVKVGLSY
jgi:hypothetical protein